MLPKAALVCVLLALISAGSQVNKEVINVDNHHLAAGKERVPQFVSQSAVFRRDSDTCLPFSDEYSRRLALLQCDKEYIRAVFNEIETSNCSNKYYSNYDEQSFFSQCRTNDNGALCEGIDDSIYHDFYDQCYRPFYTSECTSECQTDLRQLSDSVGCCIHDDYDLRMPSVWRNCDIQQPEVCADTPNIADIVAKRNVDPCTEECSLRQFLYVFCKNLGEEYEQINRECGFEDVVYSCGFDKGKFCFEMFYQISESYLIYECYSDSEESNVRDDVCSTNCSNVLVEFIDTVGCCFNFLNSTFYEYISPELFSACGIEVPDTCNSFNSTAVPDDFLECASGTINTSGAALQSGVYSIGLIILGLISTYI